MGLYVKPTIKPQKPVRVFKSTQIIIYMKVRNIIINISRTRKLKRQKLIHQKEMKTSLSSFLRHVFFRIIV